MTQATTESRELDAATIEAVDWIVRLSSGEANDEDARALEEWRRRTPANEQAFRVMAGVRPVARALKKAPKIDRRAVLSGGGGLLAAVGALMIVRPPLGIWPSLAELMADHRTGPGERYAFAPVDGVDVEMNARTSLSLAQDGRAMRLITGEAFVAVNRGPGFAVEAGGLRATAQNASVNIQTLGDAVQIACVAGRVTCEQGEMRAILAPREELTVRVDGTMDRRQIAFVQLAAWRQGMLVFDQTPLGEVIEQFNRYRPSPVVLASDSIGRRPVSGVFYTDHIEPAITQLQQLLGLRVRSLPGGVVMLS